MKMKIKMEQSPFYVERNEEAKAKERESVRTDVSPQIYQDVEKYIKQRGDDFNKSRFVKELVLDFLNNNAFEQSYFKNMNAILLLPKTLNPDELNDKAQLIGFVDVEDDFKDMTLFHGGANYKTNYRFIYTLKEFNRTSYFLLGLNELDNSYLFNIDRKTQEDFVSVKKRLSELYSDINIDDSYLIMFNLNNYLDVQINGVYRSKSSSIEHEGFVVLLESFDEMIYARFKWSYFEGLFDFTFKFHHISSFDNDVLLHVKNEEIRREYGSISMTVTREESLKRKCAHAKKMIDYYEEQFNKYETQLNDLKKS